MSVYCLKRICQYNSACCVKSNNEVNLCTKEDIMINDSVECDFFCADYKKIDRCIDCAKKAKVAILNNNEDKYLNIKVNISQSTVKDFKNLFNKDK